jgi:hypothetical protein
VVAARASVAAPVLNRHLVTGNDRANVGLLQNVKVQALAIHPYTDCREDRVEVNRPVRDVRIPLHPHKLIREALIVNGRYCDVSADRRAAAGGALTAVEHPVDDSLKLSGWRPILRHELVDSDGSGGRRSIRVFGILLYQKRTGIILHEIPCGLPDGIFMSCKHHALHMPTIADARNVRNWETYGER